MFGQLWTVWSRLQAIAQPVWLLVSHADVTGVYGGSQKYQREMIAQRQAEGWTVVQVFPHRVDRRVLCFKSHGVGFGVNLNLQPLGRGLPGWAVLWMLSQMARRGQVQCLNVQNLYQWPLKLFQRLIQTLQVPILTQFHEYSFVCEGLFMRYNGQTDCGAVDSDFDEALCQTCQFGASRPAWKQTVSLLLGRSQQVVVPSVGMAQGLQALYPQHAGQIQILPHLRLIEGETQPRRVNRKIRLAFLGLAHTQKGWDTFLQLAQDPTIQAQYDLYHLGGGKYTHDPLTMPWTQVPLDGQTEGSASAIGALEAHHIDAVMLWSQVRESYSYTLFEACAAGVPVLTHPGSGNIQAAVSQGTVLGWVLQDDAHLMAFLQNHTAFQEALQSLAYQTRYTLAPQFPTAPTLV